jgi:choline/glycine/proline betaine transport protein
MSFPDRAQVVEFLEDVAVPALEEVAEELRAGGVGAGVGWQTDDEGRRHVELVAGLRDASPFEYRILPQEAPMPVYGERARRGDEVYWRLEVHLSEGGQGYDVMGYTYTQLIDDVLDQYERHLEFVRMRDVVRRGAASA